MRTLARFTITVEVPEAWYDQASDDDLGAVLNTLDDIIDDTESACGLMIDERLKGLPIEIKTEM